MTDRRLWVVTECYPRPQAPRHCAFVHRQTVALAHAGWDVRVLRPNGWYPPVVWRLAPAWRSARAVSLPPGFTLDDVAIEDLVYQNRVPSRLCRPTDAGSRITRALVARLTAAGARPGRDVLLVHFALPYGPVVRRAAAACGLPYAIYLRGDDVWILPHAHGARRMSAFVEVVRDADLVLSVSAELLDEACRLAGGRLPLAAVVPNGIDLHRFRPPCPAERDAIRTALGMAPGDLVVVSVGDAIVRKGWIELLEALGGVSVPRRPVLLVVRGPGPRTVDIEAEAARRAPGLRLVVLDDQPADRVAEAYRAADVFSLLSHWEGVSNAVLEALASGLPVVTTALGGHTEIVTDGVEGVLVRVKSIEAPRAALDALLADADVRVAMGRAARARAERIGDAGKAGRRLAGILGGLLDGRVDADQLAESPYGEPTPGSRRAAAAPARTGV
jgi:glycosyltransferase involved in cell wall biosynthesis